MEVRRLMFRVMGTYNDMPIRPMTPSFKPRDADMLVEATQGGRHLEPSVLSSISGRIMRPSAVAEGIAPIVNGWGEQRMLFIMECVIRKSPTAETLQIITGYTDHVGISNLDGRKIHLAEDMMLHFNGKFEVRTLSAFGRDNRPQVVSNIHDAVQILSKRSSADLSRPRGGVGSLTIRPEDIFTHQTVSDRIRQLAGQEGFNDMRSSFGKVPFKFSRRVNTQASHYLSRTLKAQRSSEPLDFVDDRDVDDGDMAALVQARGAVKEPLITLDPIFEELQVDTNIMSTGYVTYGELLAMNPELDSIARVFTAPPNDRVYRRGESSNWGDRDNETLAATVIANTIPSYLMDCMYSTIHFTCTNNTLGGMIDIRIARLTPFMSEADIDANFNALLARIEHELFPDISINGQLIVDIEVESAIYGDTRIVISIDGNEDREFIFPTFCESVASPMLTDSTTVLQKLAHDIGGIADALTGTPSNRGSSRGKIL